MLETLKIFHEQDDIIEIRVIGRATSSGYFMDMELAAKEAKKYDGKNNIYFVLNKISPACYHRKNRDRLFDKAASTSDSDIEKRNWILLDFDPIPCLERLYMATPQKDYAVITQSIGRIARAFEDKQDPICYDFVDDIGYLIKSYKKRCTTYRKNGCYFVEEELE